MNVVTPKGGLSQGGGLAGSPLTQPSCSGATLSPMSLQELSVGAGGGERSDPLLINCGHSANLLPIGVLPGSLPPSFRPLSFRTTPLPRSGVVGAPGCQRRGGEKGSGRSRERWKEEVARLRGATATRERPSPCARAGLTEAQAAGGAAGTRGGAAGGAGGASGGRSEGWEGARQPAGGRVVSPAASAAAAFA